MEKSTLVLWEVLPMYQGTLLQSTLNCQCQPFWMPLWFGLAIYGDQYLPDFHPAISQYWIG